MSSTYFSTESNSVAVVPSPSCSPIAQYPSPIYDTEGFEPSPKRFCPSASSFSIASIGSTIPPDSFSPSEYSSSSVSSPTSFTFGFSDELESLESLLSSELQGQSAMQPQPRPHQQSASLPSSSIATASPGNLNCSWKKDDYVLIVLQEPESYYRARYETEGIRGPLKGEDNNHPTVQILGDPTYSGIVSVMLVHEDGTKHTSCFLDDTKERRKALSKKIDPKTDMIVEFEDLRIRRETKSKNLKEGARKLDKTKTNRNDKTACLLFTATLQLARGKEVVLTKLSKLINLCAPPEGAELEWLLPEHGHFSGDEKVVIKGTKMTAPKVTFTLMHPQGAVVLESLQGQVDKEQSHQNVLVVRTPRLPDQFKHYPGHLEAKVTVISGKAGTSSSSLTFYYIPNGLCSSCKQSLPPAQPAMRVPSAHTHTYSSMAAQLFSTPTHSPHHPSCSLPPFPTSNPISVPGYPRGQCPRQHNTAPSTLTHLPFTSIPTPPQHFFKDPAHSPSLSPLSSPPPDTVASEEDWSHITPTLSPPQSELGPEFLSAYPPASSTATLVRESPCSPATSQSNSFPATYLQYLDPSNSLPYPPYTS